MEYVYIFKSGPNHFKIGHTNNVDKRLRELTTGNPNNMEKVDVIETDYPVKVEQFLHKVLYSYICKTGNSIEHFEAPLDVLIEEVSKAREYSDSYSSLAGPAEKHKEEDSIEPEKEPTDEIRALCQELHALRIKMDLLGIEEELLRFKIQNFIGCSKGIKGLVNWKTQIKTTLDGAKLKNERPDIFAQFLKESRSRFFRLLKDKEE